MVNLHTRLTSLLSSVRSWHLTFGVLMLALGFIMLNAIGVTRVVPAWNETVATANQFDNTYDVITQPVFLAPRDDDNGQLDNSSVASNQVLIKVDGKQIPCVASGGNVESVLQRAGIELGNLDQINPPLETSVRGGETITIKRREYVTHTVQESIPFKTIATTSADLKPGEEQVLVAGEDGVGISTYLRLLVDGEIVEETFQSREIITEPVTKEMISGFRSIPVSPLNFKWDFDENGEPIRYKNVLRGQSSAGYSAPTTASTASGLPATVGHVAVDPNVIPYGSKLFIQASAGEGKYIYGYAIAADTGTAVMDGIITVDCFYGSYNASADHGIKSVDIFILE